jgi:heme A synthase
MSPTATAGATPEPPRTLRVGTVVWGLVVMAVGVGLLSVAWGAHLDTELAFIVLLGAAGVALLVGSLVGMRRSRHRLEGRG